MPKMIFVNLPVQDLAAATSFYEAIGCEKNPLFSDDKASCMVWSDSIYFMVLSKEFFSSFTSKAIADARTTTEVLTALSFDRRSDVDAIAEAAAAAGGRADIRAPTDAGWMYQRAFEDPDGHIFEAVWMDMEAASTALDAEKA
ncbi:MAG: lactoylglutathione lyase [Rhodobacteraceae bacterium]|nr:lactoylglutathione lyase [Paracoccaceae bacterium]